jgi:hypothetical protein
MAAFASRGILTATTTMADRRLGLDAFYLNGLRWDGSRAENQRRNKNGCFYAGLHLEILK